jgi:Tfp pilus assembly protein PilV
MKRKEAIVETLLALLLMFVLILALSGLQGCGQQTSFMEVCTVKYNQNPPVCTYP